MFQCVGLFVKMFQFLQEFGLLSFVSVSLCVYISVQVHAFLSFCFCVFCTSVSMCLLD